ncbi:Repeat domain-containing protein [Arthrobacter sp. yr096]|uniref:FG-GAP repeat domain-containing protein n=1 Tax=Arthrobacter sp. yr096 TaxID=1761750 RepID=UPI0008AA9A1B|nr:VCBS repeat-containing protein [Arthrobacter sp. yr096]SEJ32554.1 Repeat domain-containing protein [Arthrobacter sp. yr096]
MGTFRARALKLATIAAVALSASLVGPGPVSAASQPTPVIDGVPYVGAEMRRQYNYDYFGCRNPDGSGDAITLEWLRDGVPLPEERQGDTLRVLAEDQGSRISMRVHPLTPGEPGCPTGTQLSAETKPIKASSRAMGWTGRGNFEPLGRTADGRLILYPRTYTYIKGACEGACPTYRGQWDEPVQVGQGWNIFDIVFSPGDFDGDGFNDLLARDSAGRLFLYPGDGDGGWLAREQVGQGWNVFDSIVGPGDFNGDGINDVLARNAAGDLYLYAGDGNGGWLSPTKIGQGWQVMDKLITAGDINGDGPVEIYARDSSGRLFLYPANGTGGWQPSSMISSGWGVFSEIAGLGSFSHSRYNDLAAINGNGDLVTYSSGASTAVLWGPYGPVGSGWNVFRQLL